MDDVVDGLRLGTAEVFRVTEWLGTLGPVTDLFPDTAAQEWEADPQLAPHFYEPTTHGRAGLYRAAIQTWVVRVGGATVLVDTGVGNGRDRPQVPASPTCGPTSWTVSQRSA